MILCRDKSNEVGRDELLAIVRVNDAPEPWGATHAVPQLKCFQVFHQCQTLGMTDGIQQAHLGFALCIFERPTIFI